MVRERAAATDASDEANLFEVRPEGSPPGGREIAAPTSCGPSFPSMPIRCR